MDKTYVLLKTTINIKYFHKTFKDKSLFRFMIWMPGPRPRYDKRRVVQRNTTNVIILKVVFNPGFKNRIFIT